MTLLLGGKNYVLTVRYNDRSGVWTLDIAIEQLNQPLPLIYGLPLVLGWQLLEPYNFAMGGLVMVDTRNQGTDAGAENLEERYALVWFSEEELAAQ